MKKATLFLSLVLLASCAEKPAEKTVIRGDLYFKVTAFHNFYGKAPAEIKEFEAYIGEISGKEKPSAPEKELLSYYNKLRSHDLLSAPFIDIRQGDGKIVQVFLDPKEYPKVNRYNLSAMITRNKKLVVEVEASQPEKDIFYSSNILSVKETDGKIPWER